MQINGERHGDTHHIAVIGRFDAHETGQFQNYINDLLAGGCHQIRVNLSQVSFIDSTALATLLQMSRTSVSLSVGFVLADLSDPVRVIFELTALEQAFTIEPAVAGRTA